MVLAKDDAYEILELPNGVDLASVQTNYKRLALQWHPDKHKNSTEAIKRFLDINLAYKCITDPSFKNDQDMNLDRMYQQFQEVFFSKSTGDCDVSSDEDSSDDSEEVDYLSMFADSVKTRQDIRKQKMDCTSTARKNLTPEEIEKNATELITEEEKEKKRAEKRRAKKKRRREKKRNEKSDNKEDIDLLSNDQSAKSKDKKQDSSDSDETNFDSSAAFFTKVVNKKTKKVEIPPPMNKKAEKKENKQNRITENAEASEEAEEIDPVVLRSRQMAVKGNEMANIGSYTSAIDLFSEAIKLDRSDFRFFGNRSYCYDRVAQYEKALKDADKAISLSSEWPKGYFRKGRALAGLKLYADAEQAFMQVLKLDRNCEDAMQELLRVRTHQITEMGFSRQQAEAAIKQYGSVQQALDSLLAGVVAENSLANEVYVSDEEDFIQMPAYHPAHVPANQEDVKMDPQNPEKLTALWVGNVLPEVKEKTLTQLFSKYGNVTSVRTLPEKYCAFVNFKNSEDAGKAMRSLQGVECGGQRLLIKFPDNPVTNGNAVVIKKSASTTTPSAKLLQQQQQQEQLELEQQLSQEKLSGPVNGDECYFWRTTGCQFGNKCHYKHVPDHRGVDKKAWQKVK